MKDAKKSLEEDLELVLLENSSLKEYNNTPYQTETPAQIRAAAEEIRHANEEFLRINTSTLVNIRG